MFLLLLGGVALLIILCAFYRCQKKDTCKIYGLRNLLYNKIYYSIFWNSTMRYMLESYIEMTLQSLALIYAAENLWAEQNVL